MTREPPLATTVLLTVILASISNAVGVILTSLTTTETSAVYASTKGSNPEIAAAESDKLVRKIPPDLG